MMEKERRKKMTYFAQIVDHWDCELDFIGPFDTEEKAENAAWAKWDGDNNFYKVYIVKKAPIFFS
jgi:hypothetical protein